MFTLTITGRSLSTKSATFANVPASASDAEVIAEAYRAVRETEARCFGHKIARLGTDATVTVFTD